MTKNYKDIQKEVFTEKFKEFFEKNILKDLRKLEKCRIRCILGIVITYLLYIVFAVLLSYAILHEKGLDDNDSDKFILAFIFTNIICFGFWAHYKSKSKEIFLPKLISYVGNLRVIGSSDPLQNELKVYVRKLEIIPYYNQIFCDDYFVGTYNDVEFSVSELYLSRETGSGKRRRTVTIFDGLLISFKSFKEFSQNVLIPPNGMLYSHIKGKNPNYQRVHLEDPEFEKLFDVYGADQIEARYLITPSFMNRMVQLSKKPFASELYASFENGRVNIFVPSLKDWFEMPMSKPATDIANCRAVVLDLLSLFSIVDTLKIDQNIGM